MVRVMASGVFDLLHPGHLYYLKEAKKLGDELVVVVATDNTVRKRKHEPITPQDMRLEMVEALKPVDKAVLGHEDDMFRTVEELKPDIIALGYDQDFDDDRLREELKKRGMDIEVVRIGPLSADLNATRKLIQKIIDWYEMQERLDGVEGK